MRRRQFITLLGGTAIVWPFAAQLAAAPENLMDSQIASWMEKQNVPGLAACIVKRDEVVWSSGYGMANLTKLIPFTPDQSLFQIASVTKGITATAIMQLRDKGLLKLDEDVNKFLTFSVRNPKHPAKPITFRHLLTHTASINDSDAIYSTLRRWRSHHVARRGGN